MRAFTCLSLWICSGLGGACGGERDVDVYVVMPFVDDVCEHAGLARVELDVTGPGPESFTVRGAGCRRHRELELDGFFTAEDGGQLRFERLQDGFYWVTARVYGEAGELRGTRVMPFDPRESPIAIVFARPDLPGWPTTELEVTVPTCALVDDLEQVRVTVRPLGAFVPGVQMLSCAEARVRVTAPFGPVDVTGEGMLSDGTVCYQGSTRAVVAEDEEEPAASLRLERSCR